MRSNRMNGLLRIFLLDKILHIFIIILLNIQIFCDIIHTDGAVS